MISVISPTYNCAQFIRRSYFCLKSQTYEDWEWIVVNDGSTDETSIIFKEICENDNRVKYFNSDINRGRGFARDFALKKSSGDIIVIWDIDDFYTSNRLSKIREAINSGFDFLCSYVLLVDNELNLKGARHFSSYSNIMPDFVHATLGIKKEIIDNYNLGYDPTMRAGEDLDIMLNLKLSHKGYYCKEYLMLYVEDREVNLSKAINANRNQLLTIHNIFSRGYQEFSSYIKLKYLFKMYVKILILYFLYIYPSLYLKTVKYRNSEYIISKKLNVEILELLKGGIK